MKSLWLSALLKLLAPGLRMSEPQMLGFPKHVPSPHPQVLTIGIDNLFLFHPGLAELSSLNIYLLGTYAHFAMQPGEPLGGCCLRPCHA